MDCVLQFQGIWNLGNISLMVFLIWLFITLLAFRVVLSKVTKEKRFIAILLFTLFYFVSSISVESASVSFNRCIALLSVLSPALMYEVVRLQSDKFKRNFLVIIGAFLIWNIVESFSFLRSIGADNMRQSFREYGMDYYIVNRIFDLCYSIAIAIPCFIEIIKNVKLRKPLLVFTICLLFLFLYYILIAQYTTAILVSLILGFVFLLSNRRKSIIISIILLVFLSQLFIVFYPSFSSGLNNVDGFDELTYRLDEVYLVLTGQGEKAVDASSRSNLNLMSFHTFLSHPLFGVNHKIMGNQHVNFWGIGNHSTWLDSLARYGLFSFLLFIYIWDSLKKQRKELGILAPSFTLIILGFLNPILDFPEVCMTLLIIPLTYEFYKSKEKQKKI